MIIIYVRGTAHYGKVDATPAGVHIATKFYHVMFLPLIPLESVVVLDADRAVKAPFSFKSMLVGYLRTACFVLGTLGLAIGIMTAAREHEPDMIGAAFAGLFAIGMLFFAMGSYYMPGIGIATAERARSIDAYLQGLVQDAVAAEEPRVNRRDTNPRLPGRTLDEALATRPAAPGARRDRARAPVSMKPAAGADESFPIECPTCGQELKFRRRMVGKTTNCPACQNPILVEEPLRS